MLYKSNIDFNGRKDNQPHFVVIFRSDKESCIQQDSSNSHNEACFKNGTKKILVVEDDPIAQEIARDLLANLGLHADIVDNGSAALTEFTNYDLILLDIGLPDMDGLDVCKEIRRQKNKHQPKIIVLTAHQRETAQKNSIKVGADDFLMKPLSKDKLIKILKNNMVNEIHE